MIDIHHHCLPGVDDGPRTLAEAVDLCRMAADEGIETIVATPHVLRGRWQNTSRAQLTAILDRLRGALGDTIRVVLGSEYFFGHDMDELLRTEAASAALDWLKRGWVHVMATDAHNVTKRQPRFQAARARVAGLVGEQTAQALFVDNPKSIVENRGLVYDPDLPESSGEQSGRL